MCKDNSTLTLNSITKIIEFDPMIKLLILFIESDVTQLDTLV